MQIENLKIYNLQRLAPNKTCSEMKINMGLQIYTFAYYIIIIIIIIRYNFAER